MRFTTKLTAVITLLVALAMFLMLVGVSFSFYQVVFDNTKVRWNAIATTIDQTLVTEPIDDLNKWVPIVMRASGALSMEIKSSTGVLFSSKRPTQYNPPESVNMVNTTDIPLLQNPGLILRVTYVDPTSSYTRSLSSTIAVSVSILLMIAILLLSLRWLREQTKGVELLERRARRVLLGERESIGSGDMSEWPYAASSAIDKLLVELLEAREERGRVDTLIRAFAALDAQTGLNNRLFFDNQLTTQLEEPGSHGIVMMVRFPDFDLMRDTYGKSIVEELQYSLVNMLSTFVLRYPSALLARYFNSDFTVLLPHSSLKEADGIASQLVNSIDSSMPTTFGIDKESFMHIGITAFRSGQTAEQIIDCAEQAARNAALQGSNSWSIYDDKVPEMRRGSVRWRTLLEQMLSHGGPELYQKPAIMVNGVVHHREIMTRIFDNGQVLLPTEFMPLVQQLGLSERFDRQVITKVLPLLARWPEEVLAVSINIDSLLQHSFQIWLRDILMQLEKAQRQRILFELAEADVCQHIDRIRPIVKLIQALGCRVAVSQAGLTVVSTSYLKLLHIEIVKLHPGLVRNIDRRIENQLFLRSLAGACEGSRVKIFAASVLSRDEWQCLRNNGIGGGQGDFFAPAEPVMASKKKYSRHYRV